MNRLVPRTATAVATLAVGAAATAVLAGAGGPAGAAPASHFAYGGNAFGSYVNLGNQADVGRTANTPMCTTHAGTVRSNKTAKTDLGAAGSIGAVTSRLSSKHKGATASSTATTHTAATTLAANMIHLNAVTTSATAAKTGTKYSLRGTSTFVGLSIAGKSFPQRPAANSTYSLPGLGSVTLNEQHFGTHLGIPSATVTALDLRLGSSNVAGLPSGRIIIGRSTATLRQTHRAATGGAWATQVSVASAVGSGRTAAVYTGCGGTGKAGRQNNVTGVTVPNGVATLGVAKSTVHTTDTAAKTSSTSRNRIAGATLANGMIKVRAITTQANAALDAKGHRVLSGKGTTVLGLVINGQAMAAPRMGQQRSIPGLGTVTFGYAHKTKTGIQVYGLRIVLGQAQGNLPAGAVITVGAARAAVNN